MGMRFAGTANNQAFEALFKLTKKLMAISKRSVAELAGKATMEQTICIMVLALSIGNNDNEISFPPCSLGAIHKVRHLFFEIFAPPPPPMSPKVTF